MNHTSLFSRLVDPVSVNSAWGDFLTLFVNEVFFEKIDDLFGENDVLHQAQTQEGLDKLVYFHGTIGIFVNCDENVFDEISLFKVLFMPLR